MADLNITAEFSDLQLLKRELIDIPKKARDSASVFEREYKRVERQIQKSAIAHQRYYKEIQKANLANKSASQSASIFSRELQKQENRIDTLRAKYNPLYAASKQYERTIEEINEANRIGALTDAQREASLEQLHKEYQNGTGRFATYTAMAAGRMNQMGVVTQQAGYQIGDFLVQVQSGTNFMVAFGQQATQLVGILPMMGAGFMGLSQKALIGLSAGLGIAIPLVTAIGAAFMRTSGDAEEAASGIESLESRLKSARSEMQGFTRDIEMFRRGMEDVNEFALVQAVESTENTIKELTAQIYELEQLGTVTGPNERALAAAQELLITRRQELEEYKAAREEAEKQRDVLRFIEEQSITGVTEQVHILTTALGLSADEAKRIVDNLNLAQTMAPVGDWWLGEGGLLPPSPEDTGGGGGRSAVQQGVGGVARSLLTDVERLQLEFEERRAAIEEFNAIEIELFGSKHEALERLEAEHQARMQEIKNAQEQQSLSNTSSFFGNMAKITKSGGEKTFKLYQGFAIAQALVDAYAAFNAVLKDPSFVGRPWARAAAAGAALAQGLAQVQNIRSVTSSGGGGGGGGGGAVAAPVAAAAPEPQQVIIEGIDRDSLISGEQLSKLFDRLYEENDERGIVFSVAR